MWPKTTDEFVWLWIGLEVGFTLGVVLALWAVVGLCDQGDGGEEDSDD